MSVRRQASEWTVAILFAILFFVACVVCLIYVVNSQSPLF